MATVSEAAIDLARRLNAGEDVHEAIRAAGFDPEGVEGFEIYAENEHLTFEESDILDCSWESVHDPERTFLSITVERYRRGWAAYAKRRIS